MIDAPVEMQNRGNQEDPRRPGFDQRAVHRQHDRPRARPGHVVDRDPPGKGLSSMPVEIRLSRIGHPRALNVA